jgi:hypothetical protein
VELTEDIIRNSPETLKFRHNSDTLTVLGAGVIIYGFWSVIKVVAYVVLGIPIYSTADVEYLDGAVTIDFIMGVLAVMLAGDVIVRLIIGLCSGAEGRRHDKRVPGFYLVFTVWEILFCLFSVSSVVYQFLTLEDDTYIEVYVSFFMELTSLAILIEVYIAALSVRRYKKRMAKKLKEQKACS